jgi:hypothetical protein
MFRASFRLPLSQRNALFITVNALDISENSKNTGIAAAVEVFHIQNVRNMLCVRFEALLAQCSSRVLYFPNQAVRSASRYGFWCGCVSITRSRTNAAHTGMNSSHMLYFQRPLSHQYSASFRHVAETSAMIFRHGSGHLLYSAGSCKSFRDQ